jgi:hypothetical protein
MASSKASRERKVGWRSARRSSTGAVRYPRSGDATVNCNDVFGPRPGFGRGPKTASRAGMGIALSAALWPVAVHVANPGSVQR